MKTKQSVQNDAECGNFQKVVFFLIFSFLFHVNLIQMQKKKVKLRLGLFQNEIKLSFHLSSKSVYKVLN